MNTSDVIITREQVSEQFEIASRVLLRYEARGLIHAVRRGKVEGYESSEIRRIWTVVSLQRDLGINLAGVEAIVKLRSHLIETHAQLEELAIKMRAILKERDEDASNGQS